ncbi:MAG TPA: DoxX family protein [Steroidobacteraceae bacterium]|jgi:hypothetical protein|nr:DoxX family protein [Steroidobacteraceae bacterium]
MVKRGKMWWIGFSMSALVVAFLLMDAGMKIAAVQPVLKAGAQLGFPGAEMARTLGVVLLVCTVLYVIPRTSVLGAILITAFLGGAVATHTRVGSPLFSHVLFGVYVGVLMWGGLVLREPRLRELLPLLKAASGG